MHTIQADMAVLLKIEELLQQYKIPKKRALEDSDGSEIKKLVDGCVDEIDC